MSEALYKLPTRNKPYRQLAKLLVVFFLLMAALHSWLSSWAALEMSKIAGGWFRELGSPLVTLGGWPVMKPWAWFMWDSRLAQVAQFKPIFTRLQFSWLAALIIFPLRMMVRPSYHNADVHGSARWATKREIEEAGLLDKE